MNYRNILLVRTDRIGDVILTTPAITLLRENYPNAKIHFLTRKYTAPLLKYHDDLDEVIVYQPETRNRGLSGHYRLAQELKKQNIDLAFLIHARAGLAFALKMAKIKTRVGTGYRWFSFFLNRKVFEHRKYGQFHEAEYNLSLLKQFVRRLPSPGEVRFNFHIDERLTELKCRALENLQVSGDYIMIHPGSGGSAPNLPVNIFQKIIHHLGEKSAQQIIISGAENERSLIEELASSAGHIPVKTAAGFWNLETYTAVIAGSRLFISNSTGPLHIARAFDIPVLAFYCPAVPCSPKRWGPYNRPESVVTPPVEPCRTGNIRKCPHGNCLTYISWEAIQTKLDQLLQDFQNKASP